MGNTPPRVSFERQGPVEQLFNYTYQDRLNISEIENIIQKIEGVIYDISPLKDRAEKQVYFVNEIDGFKNTPVLDEFFNKIATKEIEIGPDGDLGEFQDKFSKEFRDHKYDNIEEFFYKVHNKLKEAGENTALFSELIAPFINRPKASSITPDIFKRDKYIDCTPHFKHVAKNVIGINSNLKIVIPCICPIPLELLTGYYSNLQSYSKIKITIKVNDDEFNIKITQQYIQYSYQQFKIVLPIIRNISLGLFRVLHSQFSMNMYQHHEFEDVRNNPKFKQILGRFFTHYVYSPQEIKNIIASNYGMSDKIRIREFIFIPFDEDFDQTLTFEIYQKNKFSSAEEYTSFLNALSPIEVDKFVIRPNKQQIILNPNYFVIEYKLVGNAIYEDNIVFNTDNSLNLDNISIRGLAHIYRYIHTVFNENIFMDERATVAKQFGLELNNQTYGKIIDILNNI